MTGRQERRRKATRRAIQIAALRLAVERGLDGLTVQAISDAADIAPRTFFTHFSSKEEALAFDRLWTSSRLRASVMTRPLEEPPLDALRAVMKEMAAEITSDREGMHLMRELAHQNPHLIRNLLGTDEERIQAIAEVLTARLGTDLQKDSYPSLIAWVSWAAGQAAMQQWLQAMERSTGEQRPSLDAFIDEAFDLLRRGL